MKFAFTFYIPFTSSAGKMLFVWENIHNLAVDWTSGVFLYVCAFDFHVDKYAVHHAWVSLLLIGSICFLKYIQDWEQMNVLCIKIKVMQFIIHKIKSTQIVFFPSCIGVRTFSSGAEWCGQNFMPMSIQYDHGFYEN